MKRRRRPLVLDVKKNTGVSLQVVLAVLRGLSICEPGHVATGDGWRLFFRDEKDRLLAKLSL